MAISLKKIHHLIRYFIILGIVVFVGYIKHWQDEVFLVLIGPVIYLAYNLKEAVDSLISLPSSEAINHFGFLMPLCVLYFGLLGFQLKQLWNERGKVKFLSIFALISFVIYIHYAAWGNLSIYLTAPGAITPPTVSLNQRAVVNRPLGNDQGQAVNSGGG